MSAGWPLPTGSGGAVSPPVFSSPGDPSFFPADVSVCWGVLREVSAVAGEAPPKHPSVWVFFFCAGN